MKKVLVTGATGFLGSHVVQRLLEEGHFVIASSANKEKAKQARWVNHTAYIPFDLKALDPSKNYYEFFQRPDVMIHLAWEGLPNYKASFHLEQNLPRHLNFLQNLIQNGLEDLTVTGTCLEYGMLEGCLTEELLPRPTTSYAIAKNELRKSLESLREKYSFFIKWIRLFYTYGQGQSPNSLLSQLEKAIAEGDKVFNMTGGEQLRDYLPVDQVAKCIAEIALQQKVTDIINCCSGNPVSVKEFVKEYLKQRNKEISLNLGYYPYNDYEPMRFWGDNAKLKTILDHDGSHASFH